MDTDNDPSPEQPTVVVTTAVQYETVRAEVEKLSRAEVGPVEQLLLQAYSDAIAAYLAGERESGPARPNQEE